MKKERKVIEVLDGRCAGIDVHKKNMVVCLITLDFRDVRTFGTMIADLEEMVVWPVANAIPMSPWKVPAYFGKCFSDPEK